MQLPRYASRVVGILRHGAKGCWLGFLGGIENSVSGADVKVKIVGNTRDVDHLGFLHLKADSKHS